MRSVISGSYRLFSEPPFRFNPKPLMRIRLFYLIFLGIIFGFAHAGPAWSQAQNKKCQSHLSPLLQSKEAVLNNGGMWSLFEKFIKLRSDSTKGLQLDKQVQNLIWLLDYLCGTIEGVPLNELATYMTQQLKEKSEQKLREELIQLGKPPAEVDLWFKFVHVAKNQQTRKLDLETILFSIEKALPLVKQYQLIAEELDRSPNKDFIQRVDNLAQSIDQLKSSDPYLSQAVHENGQVPYWDIDENYGGS